MIARWPDLVLPFFLVWRLVDIPVVALGRTAHGPGWLIALLGLAAVFGGETLGQRSRRDWPSTPTAQRRRTLVVVLISLLLLGAFPEEGVLGLLLWAGLGIAWGRLRQEMVGMQRRKARLFTWLGSGAGVLLGLTAFWGPSAWLAALFLMPLWYLVNP